MSIVCDAQDVLDRDFLTIRSRLIDLAAALDRLHRGKGSLDRNPRLAQIRQALAILASPEADYAARVQLAFSLPYREGWRRDYGMEG